MVYLPLIIWAVYYKSELISILMCSLNSIIITNIKVSLTPKHPDLPPNMHLITL